jgi:hypothetical protein
MMFNTSFNNISVLFFVWFVFFTTNVITWNIRLASLMFYVINVRLKRSITLYRHKQFYRITLYKLDRKAFLSYNLFMDKYWHYLYTSVVQSYNLDYDFILVRFCKESFHILTCKWIHHRTTWYTVIDLCQKEIIHLTKFRNNLTKYSPI